VLAIDGSIREHPLVLLVGADGALLEQAEPDPPPVGLLAAVEAALQVHRDHLSALVAVRGPGSYMGVRTGMASALGVAQALSLPLSLVGSLEVVAAQAEPGEETALVLADAGRGGTFGQLMNPERIGPGPARWRPAGLAQHLGRDAGWPGAWSLATALIGSPGHGREFPLALCRLPRIRDRRQALARIVSLGPAPITGYDLLSADYPEAVGAQ
jgi:tRNA A37 threonylcarbamoyladenosine modification protein TsaB